MARIRAIKPEFWTDEKILELSIPARLFFIGLWTYADDNGVLEYKVKQLKARIFPADDIDIQPLIDELLHQKLIVSYESDGELYLWIRNFRRHQVIDRPRKSALPLPRENQLNSIDINEIQLNSIEINIGKEGKGKGKEREKERIGRERKGGGGMGGENTQTRQSRSARRRSSITASCQNSSDADNTDNGGGSEAPPVFSCRYFEVSREWWDELLQDYPALDADALLAEIKKARDWVADNPTRLKRRADGRLKNARLFLRNWLSRVVVTPRPGRSPPGEISPAMVGPLEWLRSKQE